MLGYTPPVKLQVYTHVAACTLWVWVWEWLEGYDPAPLEAPGVERSFRVSGCFQACFSDHPFRWSERELRPFGAWGFRIPASRVFENRVWEFEGFGALCMGFMRDCPTMKLLKGFSSVQGGLSLTSISCRAYKAWPGVWVIDFRAKKHAS